MKLYKNGPHDEDCPECGGSGYDPLDGGQCDTCNGEGIVEVDD